MATAEFSKFAGILSAALSQHHLSGFEIAQLNAISPSNYPGSTGAGPQHRWALGNITSSKASGRDGILVELFQILKDDADKVLHSICQQIWKTQQWPRD